MNYLGNGTETNKTNGEWLKILM